MASPAHSSRGQRRPYSRRTRRSSFNGARQLKSAQASSRWVLILVAALVAALLVTIGTIAFHMAGASQ